MALPAGGGGVLVSGMRVFPIFPASIEPRCMPSLDDVCADYPSGQGHWSAFAQHQLDENCLDADEVGLQGDECPG
jgi:hypothetical protein